MNLIARIFKYTLHFFNIVVVLCLLLSIILTYINPRYIDSLGLISLAFMPFFIFTSFFLFRIKIWKSFVYRLTVVSVFLGLFYVERFIQFSFATKIPTNNIRLLSYNVRGFNITKWSPVKNIDIEILALIKRQDPNIVCFQEFIYHPKKKLKIDLELQKMGYKYNFPDFNKKYSTFGNIIFSKYPIIAQKVDLVHNSIDFNQVVDLKIGADTIRLINNHLKSVRLNKDETAMNFKVASVDTIVSKVKNAVDGRVSQANWLEFEKKISAYPLVICGDFNDTPMSYTYNIVSHKMKDAYIEKGKGIGASFWIRFIPLRIDYFFHSSSIKVNAYKTLDVAYSDHFPIVVDFSIHQK